MEWVLHARLSILVGLTLPEKSISFLLIQECAERVWLHLVAPRILERKLTKSDMWLKCFPDGSNSCRTL